MKNKKVLSILTLVAVGGILAACTKEQALDYSRPFLARNELKAEFLAKGSQVYLDENGQFIKINDPDDPNVNVLKELKMSQSVYSLYYSDLDGGEFNESFQLKATGYPLKASTGKITWSSSDSSIATVDQNGLVTAVSEGTAIIKARSEAGFEDQCRVVVNNNNVPLAVAAQSARAILDTQKSSSFESPKVIAFVENYASSRFCEGEVVSSMKAAEQMWTSSSDAYFRLIADYEEILTSGGSVVPSNVSYVFNTTDDYISYIFCNSNGKANYLSLDQAYLVDKGKSPFDGLSEVLQSYFVSGSSIMTDLFDNILAQKQLNNGYSGAKLKGSFGADSGQFAFVSVSVKEGEVAISQEDDLGIPAGTEVTITDTYRYLFEDNLLSAKFLEERLDYEIDGKEYVDLVTIDYYYQGRNVELFWPDVANYSLVDSIFDL